MALFRGKYNISSPRLKGFDYSSNAMYFVTICTENRGRYFGRIIRDNPMEPEVQLSPIGVIARDIWSRIPEHYPFVFMDAFIIMPDHLHGILFFEKNEVGDGRSGFFGRQSGNLGSVIRAYKSTVKRNATAQGLSFAWQPNFHDRVIRTERELHYIREYIDKNPFDET